MSVKDGKFYGVSNGVWGRVLLTKEGTVVEFMMSDDGEPLVGGHDVQKFLERVKPLAKIELQDLFVFDFIAPAKVNTNLSLK